MEKGQSLNGNRTTNTRRVDCWIAMINVGRLNRTSQNRRIFRFLSPRQCSAKDQGLRGQCCWVAIISGDDHYHYTRHFANSICLIFTIVSTTSTWQVSTNGRKETVGSSSTLRQSSLFSLPQNNGDRGSRRTFLYQVGRVLTAVLSLRTCLSKPLAHLLYTTNFYQ